MVSQQITTTLRNISQYATHSSRIASFLITSLKHFTNVFPMVAIRQLFGAAYRLTDVGRVNNDISKYQKKKVKLQRARRCNSDDPSYLVKRWDDTKRELGKGVGVETKKKRIRRLQG